MFAGKTTISEGAKVVLNGTSFVNAGATLNVAKVDNVTVTTEKGLYIGGNTNLVIDGKKIISAKTVSDATTSGEGELNKYLAANVKKVTYSGTNIEGDVTVLPGTTLDLTTEVTIKDDAKFEVRGAINGNVIGKDSATGTFENFTGDFTVKAGSVIIDGTTFTGGAYTATAGVTKISGTLTGKLTLDASNGVIQFENFVVYNTGALTLVGANVYDDTTEIITKGFCVAPEKSFDLYGEVTSENGAKIDVQKADNKSATFRAYSGAKIVNVDVIGAGKIDLSKAQSPQTVGEDISYNKTYGQLEDVTIVGSLTIKNNAKVEIKGGFQVNEGVTLTIEKGSELIINSSAASMIVDGRIVVEEEAKLTVTKAMDVKVSGSIESEGTVSITSTVTIKSGGSIVINDATVTGTNYASTFTAGADLTVEAGAELIIKSKVASDTTVTNKGTVTLDGAVLNGNFTVKMAADKAVVQILNVQAIAADRTITVTDNGLKFADKKVVGTSGIAINEMEIAVEVKKTGTSTDGSSVTVAGYAVKGLTVVETVSSETDDNGDVTYYNTLDLAGTVSITSTTDNVSISGTRNIATITGERIAITGDLTLGKYVGFTVNGKMSVSGKFVATEENSKVVCDTIVDVENGISVSGLVQVVAKINNISAAMYESKVGTTTVYNYTTLKAAIDSGAKDIIVTGTVYVAESVTVPAGVTVKNEGTIVIGSDEDADVVLTVADSASIKNGTIDVKGTLYFENKKNNKVSDINSDVSVIGENDARYTNLYTALTKANPGDTVTVDGDKVVLKKSITIKDGVTLDVPLTKHLVVDRGITISVIGTLKTAHAIEGVEYTLTNGSTKKVAFDLEPSVRDYKATIIVSGVFMSMEPVEYDGTTTQYKIPGAYYKLTDDAGAYNYVTTLENASKSTATKVDVYGKVTAGDVSFIGTSAAKKTLTVATGAELAASSITLDKAGFTSNGKFSGDVKVGDSAVTAKLAGIIVSIDKDGMLVVDNVWRALPVSSNEEPSFKVSAGTVKITGARIDVTVSEGATLVAADETNLYWNLIIDGTVLVDNGKVMTVAGDVTVNGTLTVAGVTDTKEAGTLTINDFLYVGVTDKDTWNDTGADSSVSGAVAGVKVAFVKTGSNVSEATLDSFKVGDVLKSTTYVVEDKDWMTVYSVGNLIGINFVDKAPVKDAEFNGVWKNVKGDKVTTQLVGDKDFEKVTADVKYDIYTILVNPAAGIESIAVDGNLMQFGMFYVSTDNAAVNMQMYFINVKAGTHDITCKLANGYSGEAKFTLVDDGKDNDKFNASLTGNKLTVSGDAGTATIQITGVSASGYVDPVVPEQKETEDGLSLTDILLIVLVVLIVIMAVIVAMRLMRS